MQFLKKNWDVLKISNNVIPPTIPFSSTAGIEEEIDLTDESKALYNSTLDIEYTGFFDNIKIDDDSEVKLPDSDDGKISTMPNVVRKIDEIESFFMSDDKIFLALQETLRIS